MATDPACRMEVDPKKAASRIEDPGMTYYFCSEECHKRFRAHPEMCRAKNLGKGPRGQNHGHD